MKVIGEWDDPGVLDGVSFVRDAGSPNYLDGIQARYSVHTKVGDGEETRAFCFSLADAVLIARAFESPIALAIDGCDCGEPLRGRACTCWYSAISDTLPPNNEVRGAKERSS